MNPAIARVQAELSHARLAYGLHPAFSALIVALPFAVTAAVGALLAMPATRPLGLRLVQENNVIEWTTFSAFFLAGIRGLVLARRTKAHGERRWVSWYYGLLAIGLLVVAMEEISWGQWVFGFRPPLGIGAVNKQGEFNIHNLPWLLDLDVYFILGVSFAGLLGMGLSSRPGLRTIAVPRILAPCFLAVIVTIGLDLLTYEVRIQARFDEILVRLLEVAEMLVGAASLLYVELNARLFDARWREQPRPAGGGGRRPSKPRAEEAET